jgi:ornithine cyclodeaminase/alanine dehydrogenase
MTFTPSRLREPRRALDVAELGEVADGKAGRLSEHEVTLFKSLGLGVEDLASARLAVERARERGIGNTIEV